MAAATDLTDIAARSMATLMRCPSLFIIDVVTWVMLFVNDPSIGTHATLTLSNNAGFL